MGKDDFLTPKAISKRIKAKGLQKLRWYCQMCEKQCGDEHGFKNHCSSEGHRRQMSLFAQNSKKFIAQFSQQFKKGFLDILRTRHPGTRVLANKVYNEYIQDKTHVHMNSTVWTTLTGFVKYLGQQGVCEVEDSPRGWFIRYIKRDKEKMDKMERLKNREKESLDSEERQLRLIQKQIEAAKELEMKQLVEMAGDRNTEEVLQALMDPSCDNPSDDIEGNQDSPVSCTSSSDGFNANTFGNIIQNSDNDGSTANASEISIHNNLTNSNTSNTSNTSDNSNTSDTNKIGIPPKPFSFTIKASSSSSSTLQRPLAPLALSVSSSPSSSSLSQQQQQISKAKKSQGTKRKIPQIEQIILNEQEKKKKQKIAKKT